MDVRVSGFRIEGSWEEVVEHAKRISAAIADVLEEGTPDEVPPAETVEEGLEQWEAWRPRSHEDEAAYEEEMRERTVEQASIEPSEAEAEDVGVREDLADAGRKVGDAANDLTEEGIKEAARSVGESASFASRAADQAARRAFRALEETLYRHMMTRLSPYYFDNELISANLERLDEDTFTFEINVKDDELKQAVTDRLDAG